MKTIECFDGNATREQLSRVLSRVVATVTFTKVSGEQRVMLCTQNRYYIPEHVTNNGRGWHTAATGTMSVWDVEKQDWRGFRVSSVIQIEYTEV